MNPPEDSPRNPDNNDESTSITPQDYKFIFEQPNQNAKQKHSLKERFLALSKAKQVAIVSAVCFVVVCIGFGVFATLTQTTNTAKQTTLGTADTNGDGVINEKDTAPSASSAGGSSDGTDTSDTSSDTTDQTGDLSWWQKILSIGNSGSSSNSNDTSGTTSTDNGDDPFYDSGDTSTGIDESTDTAITDDSYTNDSDETVAIGNQPSETEIDDPVDTTTDSTPTSSSGTSLTIGSWNILYLNSASRVQNGLDYVLARAQVVGLQEVGTHNTTANRNVVKNLASSNVGVYQPAGSTPIIWNARMYAKKASGYKKISAYGVLKFATYVKLRNKATGQQFYVFNFHAVVGTSSPSEGCATNVCKAYKYEMRSLASFISSKKSDNIPIFLTGDYNANYRFDYKCSLSWYPCRSLGAISLNSGYSYTGGLSNIGKSYSTVGSGTNIIDYAFSWRRSDVNPVSMQIVSPTASCSTDKSGQKHCWNGSDHKPVLFTVKLLR